MYGMDQETGKPINGISHLDQSIRKILTTRLGVSVMNRSFGSNLADLIDSPGNDFAKLEITAAVAGALTQWEPRFKLTSCKINTVKTTGQIILDLIGEYLIDGTPITIEGIVL